MGHHHSHDHGHGHGHSHSHGPASFNKAFAIAVIVNFALTVLQGSYALMAHSMSLLADAGHNFGDVLGLILAWIANWLLSKSPNERYSYGYKRTTILAAIINALILVGTSAIIAYESILKFLTPHRVDEVIVMVVAAIGIVVNTSTALLFIRGSKEDLNIKGAFLHLAGDALISLGVVLGGAVIWYTGWMQLDPLIGLLIVFIILAGTWSLLRDSVNLILDAVPHGIKAKDVEAYLSKIPGVQAIHDLHIWGLSTKEAALTVHLNMPGKTLSSAEYKEVIHELREHYKIGHITIQVEHDAEYPCPQEESC